MTWYCYILANDQRTYNGSTNDPRRRLRQHNGELKGGARATSRAGPGWRVIALVAGFPDHVNALQCEWRIKCPSGRPGLRETTWKGPAGRVRGLGHVLGLEKWTGQTTIPCGSFPLHVWVEEKYVGDLYGGGMLPDYVNVDVLPMLTTDVLVNICSREGGMFQHRDVADVNVNVNVRHGDVSMSDSDSDAVHIDFV